MIAMCFNDYLNPTHRNCRKKSTYAGLPHGMQMRFGAVNYENLPWPCEQSGHKNRKCVAKSIANIGRPSPGICHMAAQLQTNQTGAGYTLSVSFRAGKQFPGPCVELPTQQRNWFRWMSTLFSDVLVHHAGKPPCCMLPCGTHVRPDGVWILRRRKYLVRPRPYRRNEQRASQTLG